MTPRRVRSARSAAPTIGELPFASRDVGIIAKTPRGNQARRNEITVRTKSHIPRRPKGGAAKRALCGVRTCHGKPSASESRPYQDGATDLPRGSGGGVSAQCDATAKKTEATRFRRAAILPKGSTALAKCKRPRNRCRHRLFRRSFAAYPRQS